MEMDLHEQVGHTFTSTAIAHYLEYNGGPWSSRSPSEIHVCTVCHAIREYLSQRTHREFLPPTVSGYYHPTAHLKAAAASLCPVCHGTGRGQYSSALALYGPSPPGSWAPCHGCGGLGWVVVPQSRSEGKSSRRRHEDDAD